MNAMVLHAITDLNQNNSPLSFEEWPDPTPGPNEALIQVKASGVCHTELDKKVKGAKVLLFD